MAAVILLRFLCSLPLRSCGSITSVWLSAEQLCTVPTRLATPTQSSTTSTALQRYSAAHMNAYAGPIYLENMYKQAIEAEMKRAKNATTVNAAQLPRPMPLVRSNFRTIRRAYVQCNFAEQERYKRWPKHGDSTLSFPNPSPYRHDFISRTWSPDFAGFSLVVSSSHDLCYCCAFAPPWYTQGAYCDITTRVSKVLTPYKRGATLIFVRTNRRY